jgi:hypothetical protein
MKNLLRGAGKGLPQSGLQGGAGVAAFYIHRMLTSKVAFLQNNPLAMPLALIGIGHILKKSGKLGPTGAALIGAGGYAGAQVFEVRKSMQTQQAAAPAQTAGFDDEDTGALMDASDIGALMESSDIGELDRSENYADAYAL